MSYTVNKRLGAGAAAFASFLFVRVALGQSTQETPNPASAGPAKTLSAQQLDNLVAPIALYPDPLLGEVLAASTYPFEIAEAEQWVQDHPKWKPSKLMKEAKEQNWDPSIQGLVAFPQVLARLSQNISWTTPLGNAFLAQYASHMTGAADGRGGLVPLVPKGLADATWDGQKNALTPYHGYFFRILDGQGPHAPGGAHNFRVKNKLMGGFGLVAWPAQYGVTGILTFIVNQDGQIYQKDIAPLPSAAPVPITLYDPDPTWKLVN